MQTEQRGAGLRQQVRDTWTDTERKQAMATGLAGFTQRAQELRKERMTSLMGMLFDPEGLRSSFERQDERKAPGVDGVRKADYREGLEERIQELSRRVRSLGYRPKPVRRVYLPKGEGRYRPLGIPSFEDRLVQDRLSQILQAIWEPDAVWRPFMEEMVRQLAPRHSDA